MKELSAKETCHVSGGDPQNANDVELINNPQTEWGKHVNDAYEAAYNVFYNAYAAIDTAFFGGGNAY